MFEGYARDRLGRTLTARAAMAAQQLILQVGEGVDFYRQPTSKGVPGWFGPVEVLHAPRATRGLISA
eukprot:10154623-Lingulodinium_polyedra.AAC.1